MSIFSRSLSSRGRLYVKIRLYNPLEEEIFICSVPCCVSGGRVISNTHQVHNGQELNEWAPSDETETMALPKLTVLLAETIGNIP